ncbi:MAG: 50S ribosome-binding GTPase [Proteobacteria bacterium]|nr:50S ribosome-binding GTPase [Pseudomonadota bacterium]
MQKSIKKTCFCIIGNPNTGKSTLFNLITSKRQATGNYSGVTVQKEFSNINIANNKEICLVDLPGIYSLEASRAKDEQTQLILYLAMAMMLY